MEQRNGLTNMKFAFRTFALSFLFAGALAQAATVTGTVTDKTTGKPAAGDAVVLVEPMSGMSEVGHTTTDAQGHYTLNLPGSNPHLIRVTHQGAEYFADVPKDGGTDDVSVYDVAAQVKGVSIDTDLLQIEAENGQLSVDEQIVVHNTSSPALTQWSSKSFEIVLPPDATLGDGPGGKARRSGHRCQARSCRPKGPLRFQLSHSTRRWRQGNAFRHCVYPALLERKVRFSRANLRCRPSFRRADPNEHDLHRRAGHQLPFGPTPASGRRHSDFSYEECAGRQADQFYDLRNRIDSRARSRMGKAITARAARAPGNQPGGGIAPPINTPDPLSKYKWWILGGLALLLAAIAAFLLRKPAGGGIGVPAGAAVTGIPAAHAAPATPAGKNAALLNALKEELFALESEKIAGTLPQAEYAEQKAALEIVLKRALKKS